jgi:hypothetical protein
MKPSQSDLAAANYYRNRDLDGSEIMPLASGMGDGSWKYWAAYIGAGLGILNFVRSAWTDRPVFHLTAAVMSHQTQFSLEMINMAKRPLLVRRVRLMPQTIWPFDESQNTFDLPSFKPGRFNVVSHRWTKLIPANESHALPLMKLERGGWCVALITWSQASLWPYSLVWASPGQIEDICDSVNPLMK